MLGYLRARGLVWSLPTGVIAVLLAAYLGRWLASYLDSDHLARVPAVVLGGLAAAVILAPGWHRVDDEVEGAAPRLGRSSELLITVVLVATAGVVAALALPHVALERGGLEMARNLVGLSGLGLLGAALGGARLAWAVPFCWAVTSYFSVTRVYREHPDGALAGWLMYPATYGLTWAVAVGLFGLGLGAFAWGGFVPRPRLHPLR